MASPLLDSTTAEHRQRCWSSDRGRTRMRWCALTAALLIRSF